jgi:eukaryotic-like serine/threonine-protein kinase
MSAARKPNAPLFGRYQPIALLGEGSVARVYLAVSRGPVGWGNLLVIKEIRPELAGQTQFRAMFLHEARTAMGLHHPNIVQTYEIFEERTPYVVAMEFLDGQNLADLLRRVGRAGMPLSLHLWVLTQVLAGLQHAHDVRDAHGKPLRIVHRDVCPSNVFLTYDGQVKLVDFGIAKSAGMATGTGRPDVAASGKLGYGAPEQFVSQPIDPRSDVYSVGVMLWEALAGKRRRISENRTAIVDARIAGQEPPISQVVPDVPPVLAEICDRATALDRRARYQSALEMQQAIESYLDGCWEPVDRRELSDLLGKTFALERASMRRCIERQLSSTGVPLRPLGLLPRRPRLPDVRRSLLGLWGKIRLAALSALPALRTYGPAALVVVATGALIGVVWMMTASSSAKLRAAQRSPAPPPVAVVQARAPEEAPAPEPTPPPESAPAAATIQAAAQPPTEPEPEPAPPPEPEPEPAPPPEPEPATTPRPPRRTVAMPAVMVRMDSRPTNGRARANRRFRKAPAFSRYPGAEPRWAEFEPGEQLPPPDRPPRRVLDEEDPYAKR